MFQIIGFLIVLGLIVLGLAVTDADAVLSALPFELTLIGGAAVGTLMIGNSPDTVRGAMGGFWLSLRGSRWSRDDFASLLSVLHELGRRIRRHGFVAIEREMETPEESTLLARAPGLIRDPAALAVLGDSLRLMSMSAPDPQRTESQLVQAIDVHVLGRQRHAQALHAVADALPALGIVAAVLGIIKTMTAIDESTAIIGAMIASALMGTFLGVFLAYGLVGPIATRFSQIIDEDAVALDVIKAFLTAHSSGAAPGVSLELARAAIPANLQPAISDLDRAVEAIRFERAA